MKPERSRRSAFGPKGENALGRDAGTRQDAKVERRFKISMPAVLKTGSLLTVGPDFHFAATRPDFGMHDAGWRRFSVLHPREISRPRFFLLCVTSPQPF